MKFINIDMLKNEKDDIKINEDDVITIQVTNNNNINTSQKIEHQILQNNKEQRKEDVKVTATKTVDMKVEERKDSKASEVSNKTLLEVVEAKAGCWNRQLFILNPDSEITNTIKQVGFMIYIMQ